MIRSELYKVFIKQHLILFLFVFLFLNAAYHIVTGYDTTTVIRNSESYYTSFFEKYEGKITTEKTTQIKEEYKSMAYSLVCRHHDKTLEESEITAAMKKILNGLTDLGIELRS